MPTMNDLKWDALHGKLMEYKEEHGNTLVPNRHAQLGSWVSTQRRYYKEMNSGKDTPLTQARIDKLEQIEFVWATKDPRHVPWEVRYKELLDYKARNGDCIVPIGYKYNVQLANWVSTQRQEYKLWKKQLQCRITTERVNLLMSVGFSFGPPRGGARIQKRKGASEDSDNSVSSISTSNSKSSDNNKKAKTPFLPLVSNQVTPQKRKPWIKSFQDYIWCKDNGTCVLSNEMIKQWCENQRLQYILWQNNPKTSELTKERLNLLNSMHFEWDAHGAIANTIANSGNQDTIDNMVGSKERTPISAAEDIELAETLLSLGSISSPEKSPEK